MKSIRRLRSKRWSVFLTIVSFAFLCCFASDKPAKADTNVGGIINSNTTWSITNSPYAITDTVQIPEGVTLTIEPGVIVTKNTEGDMFLVMGTLSAHGASDKKIIFDGNGVSDFFHITGYKNALVDIRYSIVRNGNIFWSDRGHSGYLLLQNSELTNMNATSSITFPYGNSDISFNKFINTGGFRIWAVDGYKVTIKNNLFYNNKPDLGFTMEGYNDYYSDIVLKYNSFMGMDGEFLQLKFNSIASFSATENYWGTQDASIIGSMIYDKNDDIQCSGNIDYLPILTSAHPDTPAIGVLIPDTCTSWEYSSWSACSKNGQQTRTVASSSPSSCVGGSPVLTKSCTYVAPTCTSWTYSDWSACTEGGQTRTVLSSMPAGCAGGDSVLSRSCSIAPTAPNPDPIITTATDGALNADIKDGDIIQCTYSANPFAVYIVKEVGGKKYIRHIVNLNIFNHYKHLQWGNLKQIDSLTGFSLSGWVRVNTGPNGTAGANDKVYEINGDQTKHWINMTAQQFLTHGGSEEAIYSINQGELDLYTTGASVSSL